MSVVKEDSRMPDGVHEVPLLHLQNPRGLVPDPQPESAQVHELRSQNLKIKHIAAAAVIPVVKETP
jgi:hypothetical protein